MTDTIPPTSPETFRVGINSKLLEKARNFFNASLIDIFHELLQNSRRAGATSVTISFNPTTMTLTIEDDGRGIFRDQVAINLGGSGWDSSMQTSEDPTGCGLFSLANRSCVIESWGKRIALDQSKFSGLEDVLIEKGAQLQGTRISFSLTKMEVSSYQKIAETCALHYPLPVFLGGQELPRQQFLKAALYCYSWRGLTLGVVKHYWKAKINFHGLVIEAPLPKVDWHPHHTLTVWLDVAHCPDLQLVLPTRKEVVTEQFFENLQQECYCAIYSYIASESSTGHPHHLSYERWLHAGKLGIDLPEAEPKLRAYVPDQANPDDWHPGEELSLNQPTLVFEADLEPPEAQAFWRGFDKANLPYHLVLAEDKYRGYSWYEQLPQLTEVSFEIQMGERFLTTEEASPENIDMRPDAIVVTTTIVHPDGTEEVLSFHTDVAFWADDGFHWSYMGDASLFVTKSSAIDVDNLVELIEQSFFYPCDDGSADSWETQAQDFREEAIARAYRILSCEEVARQERIRLIIERHLRWLLPRHQKTEIRFLENGAIAVEFRD